MGPVLGVDAGGTKSHALVADRSGNVLGFGASGAANWEDVGIEAAGAALRAAVREALDTAGVNPGDIAASVFGLAGVDFPTDRLRLRGVPEALALTGPIEITNDSFVALRAGTDRPWGVVVIAGTGSVAAGRNPAGEVYRTLGLGPVYGDWGSASEVSQDGVTAVADEFTGRGPKTLLTAMLCERTDSISALELVERVARGQLDDSHFAPVVVEAAELGDAVARGILERAGTALGESAALVARALRMQEMEFQLVLAGSLFRADSPFLPAALEQTVKRTASLAEIIRLEVPPVVGAALLAMEMVEIPSDQEVHDRLALGALAAVRPA